MLAPVNQYLLKCKQNFHDLQACIVKRDIIESIRGIAGLAFLNFCVICMAENVLLPSIVACASCIIWYTITRINIGDAMYLQYQKRRSNPSPDDPHDILLVITAKEDHNGILQMDQRSIFQSIENNYDVVFKSASTVEEIANAVTAVSRQKKIKVVWLSAHGDSRSFILGRPRYSLKLGVDPNSQTAQRSLNLACSLDGSILNNNTFESIKPTIDRSLPADAIFVLNSCSTGEVVNKGFNIANHLANELKRKVIAPSELLPGWGTIILQNNPLKIRFINLKAASHNGLLGKIEQIFYSCCFIIHQLLGLKGNNIMVRDVTYVADPASTEFWPWPIPR